jgi:flagellar protein FliL
MPDTSPNLPPRRVAAASAAAAATGAGGTRPGAAMPQGRVAAPASSSSSRLWLIALAVLALVLGGGYAGWSLTEQAREMRELTPEARLLRQLRQSHQIRRPIFVPLDEFLVNLPGRGGVSEGFLQAKIVLRTDTAETETRLRQFLPLVRDRVITVLASRTMDELSTVEGKNALAADIALVVNAVIEPQLTAVYILQQQPSTTDLRNLERLGAIPREAPGGAAYGPLAREAATALARVSASDLPVQQVLFTSLVMQ